MAKVTTAVTNVSGGEISPLALGRYDLAKYANSAKIVENFLINQLGGGLYRPGTRYVASTKDNGVARLMPFQYDSDQDYVMEIGDLYMRMYSNDATLLTVTQYSTVQPTGHTADYVKATTNDGANYLPYFSTDPSKSLTGTWADNQWNASTTTNQRFHIDYGTTKIVTRIYYENGHLSGTLSDSGAKNFTIWGSNTAAAFADLTYATDTNWTQLTTAQAFFDKHSAVDAVDPKYIEVTNTTGYRYYAIKIADNWGYGSNVGLRRIALQTTLSSTEITTTYAEADIFEIQQAHKNDVKYLVHGDYNVRKLSRTGASAFTLAEVDFVRGPFLDDDITGTTITPDSATGNDVTLTASAAIFDSTHVGSLWKVNTGVVKITAVNSTTEAVGDVQVEPDGTAGTLTNTIAYTSWAEGAFSAYRGYPDTVTFHDGRLWYGKDQKIFGSNKYAYDNFDVGSAGDEEAVIFEIATDERTAIQWLASSRRSLAIGTTGGTFSASGTSGVSITPDDIQIDRDTNYGSALLPSKRISSFIYYVQRTLNKLREISYSYEKETKVANDMNLLAEHILRDGDGIVDLDQQQSPNDRLWCVRDDGQLAFLTRNAEQEVMGWGRCIAGTDSYGDGKFESVTVIPKQDAEDQIWVVVNRTIDGTTKRFIEFLTPEHFDEDWDAVRVDCSVTVDSPIDITGMTNASPGVFAATGHGLSTDDQVKLNGVVLSNVSGEESTSLDGTYTLVEGADADHFSLKTIAGDAVNTTTANGYGVYISGGELRLMTTAVSGLSHLEGEDVYVQADGAAVSTAYTVASGAITLDDKAAVVHVGFKYEGTIQLLKQSDGSATGTGQGKNRRISKVTVRVDRSNSMKIGLEEDSLDSVQFGTLNSDTVTALFTGDLEKLPISWWTKTAEIILRQDVHNPLNILSVIIESEVI